MAARSDTGNRQRSAFWRRLFGQLTRYDLVLAVIPVALLSASLVHVALSFPFVAALAAASLVSAVAVGDALFVHPPA